MTQYVGDYVTADGKRTHVNSTIPPEKAKVKPNNQSPPGPIANTNGQIAPDTKPNPNGNSAPAIKATEKEKSAWDRWGSAVTHGVLDVVGLIPVLGEAADGANALIYLAEGDTINAAISAAAMVPGFGMAATGAKLGKKAVGAVAEGAVKKGGREAAEQVGKKEAKEEATETAAEQGTKKTDGGGNDKKKPKSLREQYLGRTPGKNSKTGKEVQDRMRSEGTLRDGPDGTEFKASDGEWYPLKDADMAHNTDAVKWWNDTGRDYGAKSPEVREWMRDSKNYTLDHYSINRSDGAKLPDRYQPPTK